MLGRGLPTHPPRRLPNPESLAHYVREAAAPARRQRRQGTFHPQLHLAVLHIQLPRRPCLPLQIAGAAEQLRDGQHLERRNLASVRCGCGRHRGCTCLTWGAGAVRTLAARANIGMAPSLMMHRTELDILRTACSRHAAMTVIQFEGACSRLGRGDREAPMQLVQFVGALLRLGTRGHEAAGPRHWRGTSRTSIRSGRPSVQGCVTKLRGVTNSPLRRGLRLFASESPRAPVERQRGEPWASTALQPLPHRQLKT